MIMKRITTATTILGLIAASFVAGSYVKDGWDWAHESYMTYSKYSINETDNRIIDRGRQLQAMKIDGAPASKQALYEGELNSLCDKYKEQTKGTIHERC